MKERYKNYGFRLKKETYELLREIKKENGKSWNLFFYEMLQVYINYNKVKYRKVFEGDYKKFRKDKCEDCGVGLKYGRVGHYNHPNLVVHHRDGDISNNNPENLQTLCKKCHGKK